MFSIVGIGDDPNGFFLLKENSFDVLLACTMKQETWDIQYPEYLLLTGFQSFVFKKRAGMRGGEVGFYIKKV
jgi:hypothetical protein